MVSHIMSKPIFAKITSVEEDIIKRTPLYMGRGDKLCAISFYDCGEIIAIHMDRETPVKGTHITLAEIPETLEAFRDFLG